MSPRGALWRWPVRALAAHSLLFALQLVTFGRYLGGSTLYFVLLLPLVLVLGVAVGVVAGGALQLWGARPLVAATVVGVTAAALVLATLSWFDGWERVPPLTALAYGGPVALVVGLLTVRDARRLTQPRAATRLRARADLGHEGTPAAG